MIASQVLLFVGIKDENWLKLFVCNTDRKAGWPDEFGKNLTQNFAQMTYVKIIA
jgi:hypothetical protein